MKPTQAEPSFFYPVQLSKENAPYWIDRVRYICEDGRFFYVRDEVYTGPEDNHTESHGVLTGQMTIQFGRLQDQETH